jgi:glycosyltransferase involved in cell wall biosynthesis
MSAPTFTVLLPVHRPPLLLPYAVRSVLAQRRETFELFIICDGAAEATVEAAQAFARDDRRVRVFAHPKGERLGEAYRHEALEEARGRFVCQIGDDDLWFGNHLSEARRLMEVADFGNLLALVIDADGAPKLQFFDLAVPLIRQSMARNRFNFFGPTSAVYRLETYRALPVGWSPAPPDFFSDLFMWRKFLALPGVRCATRPVATALTFPASTRRELSVEQRREETAGHAARLKDPTFRDELWRAALLDHASQFIGYRHEALLQTNARKAAELEVAGLKAELARRSG